ncbi:hypothetical protein RP20_CCG024994 [Aedes albopictus]|nr:hypothetical protein RP20_CCG024994 [Aedes albopictus]
MRRSYEEQKMNLTRAVKKPDPKAQNPTVPDPVKGKLEMNNGKSAGPEQPRYSFI